MTSRSHVFLEFLGSSSNFLIDRNLLLFFAYLEPIKKAFKINLKAFIKLFGFTTHIRHLTNHSPIQSAGHLVQSTSLTKSRLLDFLQIA